jgi:WhiB family redox-sensing transcriptional regulator
MTRDLPAFVLDALCAQVYADLFFPEAGSTDKARAVKVCHACPVEGDCLEWALGQGDLQGIWGGTSEHDRKKLKARRNAA